MKINKTIIDLLKLIKEINYILIVGEVKSIKLYNKFNKTFKTHFTARFQLFNHLIYFFAGPGDGLVYRNTTYSSAAIYKEPLIARRRPVKKIILCILF